MTDELGSRVVLHRILGVLGGVLGLTSLVGTGCGSRTITNDGSEGADEASSSEGTDEASSSEEADGDADDGDSDTGDSSGMPPDLGSDLPPEDPGACGAIEVLDYEAENMIDLEIPDPCIPDGWGVDLVCVYLSPGSTCETQQVPELCILENYNCGLSDMGEFMNCGPFTVDDVCCYTVIGDCPVGRPFTVAGVARVAALRTDPSWSSAPTPDLRGLDDATRAALADAYAQDGLREHASLASFARFTMQLQALGAAPELIAASLRAGQDEIRHAQRCFGLASAYAGRPIGPGPLDVRGSLADCDLEPIALSLASEGCIAETVSMLLLAAARDRARDPAVRACLSEMLTDELDHVLLAWEALGALLRTHPQLRGPLARVFASAEQYVGFGSITAVPGDAVSMRAHGYLPIDERRTLALDALARVVRPAAQALLANSSTASTWPGTCPRPGAN